MLTWNLITKPYQSMSEQAASERALPAVWLIGVVSPLVLGSFAWLAAQQGAFAGQPWYLLLVYATVTVTYLAAAVVIAGVCRLVGGDGRIRRHLATWALSYYPTILAFLTILIAHLVAVPRSPSHDWTVTIMFAILVFCLLWKLLLYFMYLRVVGGLGVRQMMIASAALFVIVVIYEWLILVLGLGKVPFI